MNEPEEEEDSFERKRERLLYQSLAILSETCDVPDLTPHCPFYEMHDGRAVCAEECIDILEAQPVEETETPLSLGSELKAIRRRKLTAEPRQDERLFDAREIYLQERDLPIARWSTTTLLICLKVQLSRTPRDPGEEPSLDRLLAAGAELEERGIDFGATVRHGFVPSIVASILRKIDGDQSEEKHPEWRAVLEKIGIMGIVAWVYSASVEDLHHHRVSQTIEELSEAKAHVPPRDLDIAWMVDRFTHTYLKHWFQNSWAEEWRYIRGERKGCCSNTLMQERVIDEPSLGEYLADVGADHLTARQQPTTRDISIDELTPIALQAITRGRRSDAVSIYRSIALVRPDDADVINNLGFCLLPDRPQEACQLLERSLMLPDADNRMMTQLNLALARFLCGDEEGAWSAMEEGRRLGDEPFLSSWMWDLDTAYAGSWETTQITDLATYVSDLERFFKSDYLLRGSSSSS